MQMTLETKLKDLIFRYEERLADLKDPDPLLADMIEPWEITDLANIIKDLKEIL